MERALDRDEFIDPDADPAAGDVLDYGISHFRGIVWIEVPESG